MLRQTTVKTILTSTVMIIGSALAISVIFSTEPKAQKDGATKKTPMLVEVINADWGNHVPVIRTYGVVKPSKTIQLKPRVGGEVIAVSPQFVPGNLISQGQWLIKLDPTDFEIALERARSELTKAESAYAIEQGEQIRAQKAFELVSETIASDNKALILRQPQLKQAEAEVKTAQAMVKQAEIELQRTVITMPFSGQILSREANLGSQLTPGNVLADVIGTKTYWIESNIPLSQLAWLAAPASDDEANVVIKNTTAGNQETAHQGKLIQVITRLDEQSRMARVLIEVNDPLGLTSNNQQISSNALIAGTYVETDLPAKTINDSVKLPVQYLRKRDTAWVMKDGKLDIRSVTVLYRDENFAYISEGITEGDKVITTDISAVRQGANVELKSQSVLNLQAE
ncbi:MAG: efflux RND transporter periplasmic adaptor subunit [Gammaproteobacteria bacterium]